MIVVGDQDALTPPSFAQEMQRGIGGAELAVVPDAGHMSNMEQPAAFDRALCVSSSIGYSRMMKRLAVVVVLALVYLAGPTAQEGPGDSRSKGFDQVLDQYVRDGLVYYRALRQERARLDQFVASLAGASIDSAPRAEKIAFWLNAYNALVLRTVIDHYPIPLRAANYPARSIRQIPGAFDQVRHRVAGQTVTLDQIEDTVLAGFGDPRVFLALGRGALGSARLRSEVFSAELLETQLADAAAECATRATCRRSTRRNIAERQLGVFVAVAGLHHGLRESRAGGFRIAQPDPARALGFVEPKLLTTEKEFLAKNSFKMGFKPFDWSLNDLTGKGGQ